VKITSFKYLQITMRIADTMSGMKNRNTPILEDIALETNRRDLEFQKAYFMYV